jgi:hypothetical protein
VNQAKENHNPAAVVNEAKQNHSPATAVNQAKKTRTQLLQRQGDVQHVKQLLL